jgi:hypothetical protein
MFNHGAASWIIGGWELAGNLSRYTGLPFTVGDGTATNAGGQGQTANQINPVVTFPGGIGTNVAYFNGASFGHPATGTLGSTGRNILFGPGLFNLDANISRIFTFKEGVTFQIRGEAFNITNTPTFSNPAATCCYTTNATTGVTSLNGFGVITGTASTQRQLQVGGYLRF